VQHVYNIVLHLSTVRGYADQIDLKK